MESTLGCDQDSLDCKPIVAFWPSTRNCCVFPGIPLRRTLLSGVQALPGSNCITEYGLRTPVLLEDAPMPSTGRLFMASVATLWLRSPLSVFSSGVDSVTV